MLIILISIKVEKSAIMILRCFRYFKDTKMKANHNPTATPHPAG